VEDRYLEMHPIALTGSSADTLEVMHSVLQNKGESPWIVWDTTLTDTIPCTGKHVVTYKACLYAAECMILSTHRILERENADHVWIFDTDVCRAKDLDEFLRQRAVDRPNDDVVLGVGFSRFSRKALEHIARDFGTGLDFETGLVVTTL
jgi:hypothetical protein